MFATLVFVVILLLVIFLLVPTKKPFKELSESERHQTLLASDSYWQDYSKRIREWAEQNEREGICLPSYLNWGQAKILVVLAAHFDCPGHPIMRRLLEIWGWDGATNSQLRFDYEFEQLRNKELLEVDWNETGIPLLERRCYLRKKGRDLLYRLKFI